MKRIKRSLQLKKKIAATYQSERGDSSIVTRARSENPYEKAGGMAGILGLEAPVSKDLDSINVVDPTAQPLDKKALAKLRAKQLEMSKVEREARKKKAAEDGQALMAEEQAKKKRLAQQAKSAIETTLK